MNPLHATALLPFVPSGAQFDASRRLFGELGFAETFAADDYVGFSNGAARFILQRYDVKSFAENFMVRIDVHDLDAWWRAVEPLRLEQRYPGVRIAPPKQFPWGREVNLIDLAGVCWHIGQAKG